MKEKKSPRPKCDHVSWTKPNSATSPAPEPKADAAPCEILQIDPKDLKPHPLNKSLPRFARTSPEWQSLVSDIEARGILTPLRITKTHQVVDGETRRQAALVLGPVKMPTVPCVIIPDDQVATTLASEMALRRNLSKGQRAYLLIPILTPMIEEIKQRQIESIQAGRGNINPGGQTVEELIQSFGISKDTYLQANNLHTVFQSKPDLKEEWEPKILDLDKPVGLGACIAGIAGKETTEGKAKIFSNATQLELFTDGIANITKSFAKWSRISTEFQARIVDDWRKTSAAWPPDLRRELAEALTADLT